VNPVPQKHEAVGMYRQYSTSMVWRSDNCFPGAVTPLIHNDVSSELGVW